ncbi:MAG: hypothetical protein AAFX58_08395 [Pseudomonadota bacterium]
MLLRFVGAASSRDNAAAMPTAVSRLEAAPTRKKPAPAADEMFGAVVMED